MIRVTIYEPQGALSGVENLANASEETQPPGPGVAAGLFIPAASIKQGNTFRLSGDLGEFLGDLERYRFAATIEGDQGAGKSQFAYTLADGFAGHGLTVGIFSLEMGNSSSVVDRYKQQYIRSSNLERVSIAGEAPDGLKTVKDCANLFDVVIIDSWKGLKAKSKEFESLRRDYPNTLWFVIFQSTSSGVIRGGTEPLYDACMNIYLVKTDDSFLNNYAVCTKNRYGRTGLKYNISQKRLITGENA